MAGCTWDDLCCFCLSFIKNNEHLHSLQWLTNLTSGLYFLPTLFVSFKCMWLWSYSCACLSSGFCSIAVPAFVLIMWLQELCKGIYVGGRTVFVWSFGSREIDFNRPSCSFFLICLGGLQKSGFHLDLIVMHLSQNGHFDLTNTELQI